MSPSKHSLVYKKDLYGRMSKGPTPAMKQFYDLKEKYPGTILFFQMGDFYETFGEDAEVVAHELDITLTSRGRDKDGEKMALAGVPIHAGETYISRMVQKGYRVAVCDQIEDPKKAKGLVKRDVVRVITPGTVIDSSMIGTSGSCYLMSLDYNSKKNEFGMAFLDVSTGEFFISECRDKNGYTSLNSEIVRYSPSECIISNKVPESAVKQLEDKNILVTPYNTRAFDYETAKDFLQDYFSISSLEGFGCMGMNPAVCSAGACLSYACYTQKKDLGHIRKLSVRIPENNMVLDAITLRNLEILENIRNRGKDTSLFGVLNDTKTSMGTRILKKFLTSPLIDKEEIERRHDAVEYFLTNSAVRYQLRGLLHKFPDIERIAGRISYGNAGPRDLITLKNALIKIPEIKSLINPPSEKLPALISESVSGAESLTEVTELIESAINDEPPVLARTGGVIRDGYSSELDELRETAYSGKNWIAEFQQRERERTGIKSLKVGYNKVFGYYIEVTKSNIGLVPPEYLRKQTMSNGERYTLPVLQEKESLISNAEEKLLALELELFNNLILSLTKAVPAIQKTSGHIGLLDVYAAFGNVSDLYNYKRPVIENSGRLIISDGRHPVVERNMDSSFVPNDSGLESDGDQILIITGANMAGKSTYMRQVALITVMAQAGCFVPAAGAVIGIVDRIFTRVGAFDDLSSGQSTFMVEMLELANILNNITDKSLVILDEIGRGTSTLDGYSIAKAVLEYLHSRSKSGPRTLFATHFHEMVGMEGELKRVKNYHFAVNETGRDVVFLRKIIPGATDRSYGIHVAKLAGIPNKVLERASEILKAEQEREYSIPGRVQPRYTQMLLIDQGNCPAVHDYGNDNRLAKRIREIDTDSLTPREALTLIYALKEETGDDIN